MSFRNRCLLGLISATAISLAFIPVHADGPRNGSIAAADAAQPDSTGTSAGPISPTPGPACYSFTTIARGEFSGFGEFCGGELDSPDGDDTTRPCYARVARPQFEAIIRGQCAWEDFWREHASIFSPPPPVPAVDFTRFAVIAVVAGPRPDDCRGIEVARVVPESCGTRIYIRERIPCQGEACGRVITNPFHFVLICKDFVSFETPVCFEHRNRIPNCTLSVACLSAVIDE